VCHKAFSDRSSLRRHNRTHTGVWPCDCDVCLIELSQQRWCVKAFSDKSNLILCNNTHIMVRAFICGWTINFANSSQ
jgi:hypothetical protein